MVRKLQNFQSSNKPEICAHHTIRQKVQDRDDQEVTQMKTLLRKIVVLTALAILIPVASYAVPIQLNSNTVGQTFMVDFSLALYEYDGDGDPEKRNQNLVQDLSAQVAIVHQMWDPGSNTLGLLFDVNNSSEKLGNEVSLWALAFGINPTATEATLSHIDGDDKFNKDGVNISQQLTNGVLNLTSGAQVYTHPPGYPNTLQEGMRQHFSLDIVFNGIGDNVTLSPFVSGWQTKTQSFQFGSNGGTPVPEPSALLLLGFGMVALGIFTRRRAAKS